MPPRAPIHTTSQPAARICSAGNGGQILVSETTRALIGNNVPDGVVVRDLGEARLKDIQYERIFELALAEQTIESRPLKTAVPASAADYLAAEIQRRVNEQILASLDAPGGETKRGALGLVNRLLGLRPPPQS